MVKVGHAGIANSKVVLGAAIRRISHDRKVVSESDFKLS